MKWPSTDTASSTMPEMPERLTTTSLKASAEKITPSSRTTWDSSSMRVSDS